MSRGKVGPDTSDVDAKVLADLSNERQQERLDVFTRKYNAQPERNIIDVFKMGLRMSASRPCLGTRSDISSPFTWLSYQEVLTQATNVGSFLSRTLHLKPDAFVGIYSKNRAEWVIFELGCYLQGLVPVPLYDTLGPEATDHILKQTGISVMLCESPNHVTNLNKLANSRQLQHVIQITGKIPMASESKQQVWSWQEVLKSGRDSPSEGLQLPGRNSLALLCYTSGTTGLPKGVQITHGNLISEGMAMAEFMTVHGGSYVSPGTCEDVYLSYLPLAHIFERIMHVFCFIHGMRIGFYRGDVLTLVNDMQELKPTIFCTVPRLLNRIYEKTLASVSTSCLRAAIFRTALHRKTLEVNQGVIRKNSFWDRLVFSKIQASTGNKIRLVIVGSAPLAEEVMRFSRVAFGCPVIEGYGQTESTGGTTVTIPGDATTGNVGTSMFTNVVQLQDVPEMDYYAKDGFGEVCIRGLNVTPGYYRMPEETAKTIDNAGWLHTGDIGQWTESGCLRIVDRKKHIFKLAQGEYIAPEKIEQVYCTNVYVSQVYVYGESLESYVLAVVVPNPESIATWANQHGATSDVPSLCQDESLKAEILTSMLATGRANNLKSFEQVKDIYLHPEPFTVENGLLTPTFKSMRNELKKAFAETFKRMYFDLKRISAA